MHDRTARSSSRRCRGGRGRRRCRQVAAHALPSPHRVGETPPDAPQPTLAATTRTPERRDDLRAGVSPAAHCSKRPSPPARRLVRPRPVGETGEPAPSDRGERATPGRLGDRLGGEVGDEVDTRPRPARWRGRTARRRRRRCGRDAGRARDRSGRGRRRGAPRACARRASVTMHADHGVAAVGPTAVWRRGRSGPAARRDSAARRRRPGRGRSRRRRRRRPRRRRCWPRCAPTVTPAARADRDALAAAPRVFDPGDLGDRAAGTDADAALGRVLARRRRRRRRRPRPAPGRDARGRAPPRRARSRRRRWAPRRRRPPRSRCRVPRASAPRRRRRRGRTPTRRRAPRRGRP